MKTPLLIVSDAPSAPSGLGRICRDLATRIHANLSDIYDTATLGYGGSGDKSLPFMQYTIEGMHEWFIPGLQDIWDNFAEGRQGAVLFIWDSSRLLWFARQDVPQWCPDRRMREWLQTKPLQKWIYAPMDAEGPHNMLSRINAETMLGFDRIIAYSDWAKGTIERTLGPEESAKRELVAIPHGIDTAVFKPYRKQRGVFRQEMGFDPDGRLVLEEYEKIIGIVATNQARKDYGLAFAALEELSKDTPFRFFVQIDTLERHWSIPALLYDHNLMHRCILSDRLVSDQVMAKAYSACDLTLGIGPEGFGFPLAESLACGTPVLAGSYGGQTQFIDKAALIAPEMSRLEGVYNTVRPVYDPQKWAYRIKKMLREEKTGESLLPKRFEWDTLWAAEWEGHFRKLHQSLMSPAPILEFPSNTRETDTVPVESDT